MLKFSTLLKFKEVLTWSISEFSIKTIEAKHEKQTYTSSEKFNFWENNQTEIEY